VLSAAAGAILMQLKRAAEQLGISRGQTTHGFRRGSIQHQVHVEGASLTAVSAKVGIQSEAVAQRYANRSRHQPTVRRKTGLGPAVVKPVLRQRPRPAGALRAQEEAAGCSHGLRASLHAMLTAGG
jgi:hypothetical protein